MIIQLVIYQILLTLKKYYKLIAVDLSKQTNLISKLSIILGTTVFFIIEKSEETINNGINNGNTKDCKFIKEC